jgi:hypothetical protein
MVAKPVQHRDRTGWGFCALVVYFSLAGMLFGQEQTQTPTQTQTPVPQDQGQASPSARAAAQEVRETKPPALDLDIDAKQKELRLRCRLAVTEGILEFFLVDEKGRTYESVFKLINGKPSDLQFALLLLGFEPLPFKEFMALKEQSNAPEVLKKKKCLLQLEVQYKNKRVPLTALLKNREGTGAGELYWVFTGAPFDAANKYTADYSDVYIGIWAEPYAVINLLTNTGNPYRGNLGFEIAAGHGFQVEDEFTLIIKGVQ